MSKRILLLLLLVLLPGDALADVPRIEIDTGDKELSIKGWAGEDNSFIANARVTLRGVPQNAAHVKLSILASDLKKTGGNETIGRQQVEPTEISLTPELPTTIQIKIKGVKEHGEYTGTIELLLPGQPRGQADNIIKVTLRAEVRPTLALLTESDRVQANIVHCNIDCWLARFLLPASGQNSYELRFEKPVAAPLAIIDKTLSVRGEQTRFQLADKHLVLTLPTPTASPAEQSPAGQPRQSSTDRRYISVPVTLNYADVPADHYTGTILMSVAGQAASVKVPVDINVRVGPLWPLLFLVGGVLLGKLAKYMQETGNPKADVLVSVNRIEFRLEAAHEDDRAIIAPMIAQARQMINEDQLEQATPLIKSIDARLATLNELREIEGRLAGKEQHPTVQGILVNIRQARERIRQGQDVAVKPHVDAIRTALVELSTTMMSADNLPDLSIVEATERAKTAAASTARAALVAPPPAPPTGWQRIRAWFIWFSGVSDEFRTEATLWILRPLMWTLLILLLIAIGMKSLYVDNPIFGASSFDYFSLVFWGLSADVASRAISNLKLTKAGGSSAAA